jgi:HEAT repeat protein
MGSTALLLRWKISCLWVSSAVLLVCCCAVATAQVTSADAWPLLQAGIAEHNFEKRAAAVSALGLLRNNRQAAEFAEKALRDERLEVRKAAAMALGQMRAKQAIPSLQSALKDSDATVILAAASSLKLLGDPSAFQVYYAVLAGEQKGGRGIIAEQKAKLHDPKKMAQLGFEEGVGFIPFGGIGYGAIKTWRRNDSSPVRAAAARELAHDPNPRSAEALAQAVGDDSWLVRAAALDAIARRGDPALLPSVLGALADDKDAVRFTAAATAIRLSSLPVKTRKEER